MTAQDLTDTENEIARLWNEGELPYLVHLMGGNESYLVDFFHSNIKPTDWVFASHRCHFHALLHGMDSEKLIENVKAGRSMFLYMPRFICSAIVAGTACIAAGMALSIQRRGGSEKVFCFVGDGACDEGHFTEAVRFVHALKLPCVFIVEHNNSSCGVTQEQRGAPTDWIWPDCVIEYRYTQKWGHAGTGVRPTLKIKA